MGQWHCRLVGSKADRVARAFLYYRIRFIAGCARCDIFSRCGATGVSSRGHLKSNASHFKDYGAWVEETHRRTKMLMLKDVPADAVLMRTFKAEEKCNWREW